MLVFKDRFFKKGCFFLVSGGPSEALVNYLIVFIPKKICLFIFKNSIIKKECKYRFFPNEIYFNFAGIIRNALIFGTRYVWYLF